jgi:hypothetical protein
MRAEDERRATWKSCLRKSLVQLIAIQLFAMILPSISGIRILTRLAFHRGKKGQKSASIKEKAAQTMNRIRRSRLGDGEREREKKFHSALRFLMSTTE